ncbi:MAG: hypothetical protein MUE30_12670 [Spirosomaceae bacterium]|jgi:hypothetical protein|nr:hypothetical protein [Spirosomataceae bacterium]
MNALRQYVTTTDGNVILKLPAEYTRRRLEIIVLPADDTDDELSKIMDKMSDTAEKNGLTPEILAQLLADE